MWFVRRCGVRVIAVEGGGGAYVVGGEVWGTCDSSGGWWRSVCGWWGGVGYV